CAPAYPSELVMTRLRVGTPSKPGREARGQREVNCAPMAAFVASFHGGGDQPLGVGASPFGWAVHMREHAAVLVDQQGYREAHRKAAALEVVEEAERRVAVIAKGVDPCFLKEGLRLLVAAGIDIDRHHLEAVAAELFLQLVQRR